MAGALWEQFFLDGSFGGVGFDFVQTTDEFGAVLDVQELVNKPGANIDFRNRATRRFSVTAVFIDDDYPDTMNKLINKIELGIAEFIHPVYGRFQAAIEKGIVEHDAEWPDSAMMRLQVIEHTADLGLVIATRTPTALASAVSQSQSLALAALTAFSDAQQAIDSASDQVLAVERVINNALASLQSVSESIQNLQGTVTAADIQSQSNVAALAADVAIQPLENFTTPEAFDLSQAVMNMIVALQNLAEAAIEVLPPVIEDTIQADITLLAWVHAKYGDSSRVDEIMALNTILDPLLLTAGMTLRRYAV